MQDMPLQHCYHCTAQSTLLCLPPVPTPTQVQSWTPQLVLKPLRQSPANALVALLWCSLLVVCPLFLGGMVQVRGR
jgi:hypothetical protein